MEIIQTAREACCDQQPQAELLSEMDRKLRNLKKRYNWRRPVFLAAWNYGHALICDHGNSPDAISTAREELLTVLYRYVGLKAVPTAEAVQRRFAVICSDQRDLLHGVILPGFYESWFPDLYKAADYRREYELRESA
jgi:hypothetical protein